MAEKPSLKQILEIYYALRASGVQRYPRPLKRASRVAPPSGQALFLYDFSPTALAAGEVPAILRRLLERLPWGSGVQVFSALEAQPKTPALEPVSEAAVARLRERLLAEQFGKIVCFGWRAAHLLSVALGLPYAIPAEAFEPLECEPEGLSAQQILVLPDVRELEMFPDWRARVWDSLVNFAQK